MLTFRVVRRGPRVAGVAVISRLPPRTDRLIGADEEAVSFGSI